MDRERIQSEMLALEQWMDASNPPLFGLLVQASGAAMAMFFPLMETVRVEGTPEQRHAALVILLGQLDPLVKTMRAERDELERSFDLS
jgi:hypothetical protein